MKTSLFLHIHLVGFHFLGVGEIGVPILLIVYSLAALTDFHNQSSGLKYSVPAVSSKPRARSGHGAWCFSRRAAQA